MVVTIDDDYDDGGVDRGMITLKVTFFCCLFSFNVFFPLTKPPHQLPFDAL